MKKIVSLLISTLLAALAVFSFGGCAKDKDVKIGVVFGVGAANRWVQERQYMIDYCAQLGVEIVAPPLNTDESVKPLFEDCKQVIDKGVDVLVLTPRDVNNVSEILAYAKEKKVKVICYSRAILKEKVALYVGYDSKKIGQTMGNFLVQEIPAGDYLVLKGDPNDNNAKLLYEGAKIYIENEKDVNVIDTRDVASWSPETAKAIVKEILDKSLNKLDAIFAPNDAIAGACAEVLAERNLSNVAITGMDAELSAIKRIVAGTQRMTVYMNLKTLARTAIEQAVNLAKGKKMDINSQFDNGGSSPINANLINGQLIIKQNIKEQIIDKGVFTYEEVYGVAEV